jgi:hypothetical protein
MLHALGEVDDQTTHVVRFWQANAPMACEWSRVILPIFAIWLGS